MWTCTFAIMLSTVCLSSVVGNARAPYSGGCNFRQYFYGVWYVGHPLTSTENLTEIVPGEPLRRGVIVIIIWIFLHLWRIWQKSQIVKICQATAAVWSLSETSPSKRVKCTVTWSSVAIVTPWRMQLVPASSRVKRGLAWCRRVHGPRPWWRWLGETVMVEVAAVTAVTVDRQLSDGPSSAWTADVHDDPSACLSAPLTTNQSRHRSDAPNIS